MEIYKYTVDKNFVKNNQGRWIAMMGKRIPNVARGYVFVDSIEEAYRIINHRFPCDESIKYDIHLERTNIVEM